jgi:hypothetical protein
VIKEKEWRREMWERRMWDEEMERKEREVESESEREIIRKRRERERERGRELEKELERDPIWPMGATVWEERERKQMVWQRKKDREMNEISERTMNEFLASKRARDRAIFMFMFLSSLVFGAGAIGGFIIVGQMLEDYGSCIILG